MNAARSLLVAVPLALVSAACAGAAPSNAASASPSPSPPSASMPWKDMNHAQRLDYMKQTVFPQMKEEFTAFDGQRFGDMTCATCHGDGAKAGTFTMPNPALPKLSATNEFAKHRAATPKILDFMLQKVEPDMAKLLSEPAYDRKTHLGFSCFRCHLHETDAP